MRRLIAVLRTSAKRFSADGCAFLAQAIAFNALFAVFPLLLLALAVLAFVYGTDEAQQQAIALFSTVAPGVQETLTENLHQVISLRSLSGAIGLVVLIWSGKNLFMALAFALDRALGVEVSESRPLLNSILVSLVILPVLGVLLIVATAVPVVISVAVQFGGFPHSAFFSQLAGYASGFLLVFTISALLYTYLPSRQLGIGFGVPGALFTALAWEAAQIAFAVYTTHVSFAHVYGALATFAVLLLWFYYMGIIFLYGAQLSAQWHAYGLAAASQKDAEGERLRTA
jgi:membrane protein